MIRKCGLVGGRISLGVSLEVSKAHARSSLPVCLPVDRDVPLGYCSSAMRAATTLAAMIMD